MTQAIDNFFIVFQRMDLIYNKFVKEKLGLDPTTASLNHVTNNLQKDSFDDSINEGFELYILIKLLLVDNDPNAIRKYKEFEAQLPPEDDPDSIHRSMQFYQKFTGMCEVVVNDDLFKVFFPILPICRFLSGDSKKHFLENVDRDSPQHKINGFLAAIPDFIDEMEHAESLRHGKIKITPKVVNFIRDCCLTLAFIINMIILYEYEYVSIGQNNGSSTLKPQLYHEISETVLFVLGIALISSCSLLLFLWLITSYSLLNKRYWRAYVEKNRLNDPETFKKLDSRNSLSIKPAKDTPLTDAREILKFYGIECREFNYYGKLDFGHFIIKLEYYSLSITFIFKNSRFQYF